MSWMEAKLPSDGNVVSIQAMSGGINALSCMSLTLLTWQLINCGFPREKEKIAKLNNGFSDRQNEC